MNADVDESCEGICIKVGSQMPLAALNGGN